MKKVVLIALALFIVLPLFSFEKNEIRVITENLRLRSESNTSSDPVTTLQTQSLVQVQEVGPEATIDGIKANWIKVRTLISAKTREGDVIAESLEGWGFGGYTSLYDDDYYAPVLFLRARNGDIIKNEADVELPVYDKAQMRCSIQAKPSLEKQVLEDGTVLYVQRDKLYEEIFFQTESIYAEYSRAYLEVDGNLYLVAVESGGYNFSDYSCQKTRNGYLIEKSYYYPFEHSDGNYIIDYFYVSSKNGTWYVKSFHCSESVVEDSGEHIAYIPSETGDDFLFTVTNFTNCTAYRLCSGTPVSSEGINVPWDTILYAEPNADSEIVQEFSYGAHGLPLESGETFVEHDTVEYNPIGHWEEQADWEVQWVKVQIAGTDLIGWYKNVLWKK